MKSGGKLCVVFVNVLKHPSINIYRILGSRLSYTIASFSSTNAF